MRVIIVGGGFAAVQFAKTLRKGLRPSECKILLFNRENHMVFHPLLADVAGASLTSLIDPIPPQPLRKETTLADAIRALNESGSGQLLVLDEKQRLWATLDRDDLYHIIARIAATPIDTRGDVSQRKLGDLLLGNPVYVSLEDSTLVASATMLDHGISWLPVVQSKDDPRPVGCLRGERIGNRMIQKITHLDQARVQAAS